MKKRTTPRPATNSLLQGEQRINKVLAAAGLGSRRQVDELIEQGRVEINGKTVQQVGVKVDPETATITVDGEPLRKHRPVYFALHKPEGVLCTNRDPEGRTRVVDMVPNQFRLFPVGRLDASSTGLILLTNDGELAQRLTHPRHGVPKRYAVTVAGQVELDSLKRLQRGIHLAEGRARVDQAKLKRVRKGCSELEITLSEGKNREIRRVLARLGHKVVSLRRIGIGPLKLGDLPEGAYRPLGATEIESLYEAVESIKRARKQERKDRRKAQAETTKKPRSTSSPARAKPIEVDLEDQEDDAISSEETEILVKDTMLDSGEDWRSSTGQRLGAVIGDDDFAPPSELQRKHPRSKRSAPQGASRGRSDRPVQKKKAGKRGPGFARKKSPSVSRKKPKRGGN
jgi:23S rRNA pseudouridine2605 synthase